MSNFITVTKSGSYLRRVVLRKDLVNRVIETQRGTTIMHSSTNYSKDSLTLEIVEPIQSILAQLDATTLS